MTATAIVSRETSLAKREVSQPGAQAPSPVGVAPGLSGPPAYPRMCSMLSKTAVRKLLAPFEVSLSDETIDILLKYLDLLLRWNRKINLTSVRTTEECITRHFGESFYLSHVVRVHGRLLDVGSGAGFPGLAVKLLTPELDVTLLEPVAKKRAFLKEVARNCELRSVRVLGSRIQECSLQKERGCFDIIATRAVGGLGSIIPAAIGLLKSGGRLCLWLSRSQIDEIRTMNLEVQWLDPLPIPLSRERMIFVGKLE